MEMKASLSSSRLSPDSSSDPEEKEVSDEDDDDRNHKHRRREARSHSVETDVTEQAYGRLNRKRHKPFENGRQYESQGSDAWKSSNAPGLGKDISGRFDKRRHGQSRDQFDFNQRGRINQTLHGEPGPGRGRDSLAWNQRDLRFNQLDATAQIIQQGPLNPNLFGGRGMTNVANPRPVPWNAFGLVPGMSNTGFDSFHPLGYQATLRPTVNPTLNVGIPRPRCRDFEEQGFCLRGDMCPMEHGVNRIVVEDVQSLSQFNLPVPLPSGQRLVTPVNPVVHPSVSSHSAALGSRSNYGKNNIVPSDVNLEINGGYSSPTTVTGADLYDPDVPLWNEGPETSHTLSDLHSLKNDETEPFVSGAAANRQHTKSNETNDTKILPSCAEGTVESPNTTSVWGRNSGSIHRSDGKDITNFHTSNSGAGVNEQGRRTTSEPGFRGLDGTSARKKASRTLFVIGIPQKSNRKEILMAHFKKFGQIIDIHIPASGEKAFVQFSKREEAEAALESPDAVMGNRFIKVWWANRDNFVDYSIPASGNRFLASSKGVNSPNHAQIPVSKTKDNNLSSVPSKGNLQKKLELEHLKQELRKKQELLEQKRNDFKRQLDKFEKQSGSTKAVEVPDEVSHKRQKIETENGEKPDTSTSKIPDDDSMEANKQALNPPSSSPKVENLNPKQPPRPSAPRTFSPQNRYKLDNRPTSFRILPPLPSDLSNVDALTEHFSSFGHLASVELQNPEPSEFSALVRFSTRHSAEKAFLSGKCWKGNTLQFSWRNDNPQKTNSDIHVSENLVPSKSEEEKENSDSTIMRTIESDVISHFQSPLISSESPDSTLAGRIC